jgi:isocitrate dehydrogenase
MLKAPITTPQGGGYKSLNVTMRKTLGLYANVRPVMSYYPFVKNSPPQMDMVIVRENEEDLYTGIEHRGSNDVFQCLKILTRTGSERILRYAFDYAVKNGRKKVTCMSKDNIMKMADGMFHKLFDEIGAEYPKIEKEHFIIDIGAARIASRPAHFDVIVTLNLYGDIISDIAAEVSGSVGLAGSSNIGDDFAMFEAIHGSAPDIAGKNLANPSGILQSGVMMLVHIGQPEVASRVHNAWLRTLEDGVHTGDIFGERSTEKVGTQEFALAVVARLGKKPQGFTSVDYKASSAREAKVPSVLKPAVKELRGVDVFVDTHGRNAEALASAVKRLSDALPLRTIASKGLKIWPEAQGTGNTDQVCCRFLGEGRITHEAIAELLEDLAAEGIDFTKIENLYAFDGQPGYSLGQGE